MDFPHPQPTPTPSEFDAELWQPNSDSEFERDHFSTSTGPEKQTWKLVLAGPSAEATDAIKKMTSCDGLHMIRFRRSSCSAYFTDEYNCTGF
jgi:hypothetical protein